MMGGTRKSFEMAEATQTVAAGAIRRRESVEYVPVVKEEE